MYRDINTMSSYEKKDYFWLLNHMSEENERDFIEKDEYIKKTQLDIVKILLKEKRLPRLK